MPIVVETRNLHCVRLPDGRLEMRLRGATTDCVVGNPSSVEAAERFARKLEARGIENLRRMYQHY